ncbi:hypothetical protein LAT59_01375 [Candidatus Gracilibacteria bacterium]|nr:hypothetical protein [Candidatus Gracilibacteria bacterium]
MNHVLRIFAFLVFSIFSFSYASASVDRFEVELNFDTAQIGEALDITITAVDRNGETVTNYLGDILVFSESDPGAEFPSVLSENSYKYIPANEGSVKFENAVIFRRAGTQNIYVYDLNQETVMGLAEVEITDVEVNRNEDIDILSPETGITLGRDNITVSGRTQKNHQINIKVNGTRNISTTSNDDGIFEINVENLNQGENTFQAQILDSSNNVIGESSIVRVQINSIAPEFRNINITPTGEVEAESEINIEVISNTGLRQVNVLINDVITQLSEIRDGRYTGRSFAPSTAGVYPVTVILSNEFNIETREENAAELIVREKVELNAAPEEEDRIIEEIGIRGTPQERASDLDLRIRNIRVTELKERSIITWDPVPDAESYNVYKRINERQVELIANVQETRYEIPIVGQELTYEEFAIKALGRTQTGTLVQGDLSDMTKVQTGPTLYFTLLIIAVLLSGGIFFLKSRKLA